MAKQMLLTEEGYKNLIDELDHLKNIKRQEVKDSLAVARSYGDLSENSEYDEAKNEQAKVEARISELEDLLTNTKVIDESKIQADVVNIGGVVKVYDIGFEEEIEYSIVGSNEANPLLGKISDHSPIGSAIIGSRVGDEVSVDTPNGSIKLKILEVHRAKDMENAK